MASSFIPSLHFDAPSTKLSSEWCMKAVNYFYYNSFNQNLLSDKNIREIDEYATGNFSMVPYKRMFKSMQKKMNEAPKNPDGSLTDYANNLDTVGLDWGQLSIIASMLNSAIESIMKLPMDISCTAQDALAMKKKKEDVEFLKNKPIIEADLQDIADQMSIGKVEIGTTKNSSVKFSDSPMGLDLNNPEHEDVFVKLFYSLKVETAFEKFLKQFSNIKNMDMIRRLLVTDHFKYGIASISDYVSSMTGLPDAEYIHSSRISAPKSSLPDFSDNTHRIIDYQITVMEMFNYFSDEIGSEQRLHEIINGKGTGYCDCNKRGVVDQKSWGSFKVNLKLMEVKSLDGVGVKTVDKGGGKVVKMFTDIDDSERSHQVWAQNTYRFWWLVNTDYCFGIEKLPFSHRTKGKESFQNFSTHIYKSQEKSAVELCIPENKMAQIAYIKLQHAIIKSAPQGKYFDLRFMRSALSGLQEGQDKWTMHDLINLFIEHNIMIGDTEGFDGKNDGQIKPYMEIPGGLRAEVSGYWTTISNSRQNCGIITGINQQVTGQNPEELIGLQELQINAGLNAINYCNAGIQNQFEGVNNNWASQLQGAIEEGGATKKAIINYIGEENTELLDSLDEAPLHTLTIKVDFGRQQYQMQAYQMQLNFLKSKNVLTTTDEYLLSAIDNPKEKFQKLYFIEERWKQEQEKIRQEQFAQQQQLMQQQGQNMVQAQEKETEGDIKVVYAKGDVESRIIRLSTQLGLTKAQTEYLQKLALQRDRGMSQKDKALSLSREKANIEQQKAIA